MSDMSKTIKKSMRQVKASVVQRSKSDVDEISSSVSDFFYEVFLE